MAGTVPAVGSQRVCVVRARTAAGATAGAQPRWRLPRTRVRRIRSARAVLRQRCMTRVGGAQQRGGCSVCAAHMRRRWGAARAVPRMRPRLRLLASPNWCRREPDFTTYTKGFVGAIDFIFYSHEQCVHVSRSRYKRARDRPARARRLRCTSVRGRGRRYSFPVWAAPCAVCESPRAGAPA